MYLRPGDRLTVRDLLYGLLLSSGNDAAYSLAEATAGSVQEFARLMNQTAERYGAGRSHFVNPSGLPDSQQYVTALDMALITRNALLAHPELRRIVGARRYDVQFADGRRQELYNHNDGLGIYGFDGVKNGYTITARHTYVATETRNGWQLLAVTLRTSQQGKYTDAHQLFEYGFKSYVPAWIGNEGTHIDTLPIEGGTQKSLPVRLASGVPHLVPLRRGGMEAAVYHSSYPDLPLKAPVNAGRRVGTLDVFVNDSRLTQFDLYAAASVPALPPPPKPVWWIVLEEAFRILRGLFR